MNMYVNYYANEVNDDGDDKQMVNKLSEIYEQPIPQMKGYSKRIRENLERRKENQNPIVGQPDQKSMEVLKRIEKSFLKGKK